MLSRSFKNIPQLAAVEVLDALRELKVKPPPKKDLKKKIRETMIRVAKEEKSRDLPLL